MHAACIYIIQYFAVNRSYVVVVASEETSYLDVDVPVRTAKWRSIPYPMIITIGEWTTPQTNCSILFIIAVSD